MSSWWSLKKMASLVYRRMFCKQGKVIHVYPRHYDTKVIESPQTTSVAVAMSGGIDSAVTALLLKRQGYNITGIFMRNWDSSDEAGDDHQCPINQDYEDMKEVCVSLNIPSLEVNFVKDYWLSVFAPFVEDFQSGQRTPNPDVSCNANIKFDKFREHVLHRLGFDCMATGHYARVQQGHELCAPRLLRGVDESKDQSYFLATTAGTKLSRVMFPLGELTKKEVKRIAQDSPELQGLRVLTKKESMGICFVGKRKMADFLPQYFTPTPGRFIDIDSSRVVGSHSGAELFTVGQKAKIGGAAQKYFIVQKCLDEATVDHGSEDDNSAKGGDDLGYAETPTRRRGDVLVAAGGGHSSLMSTVLETPLESFNWVAGRAPKDLSEGVDSKVSEETLYYLQIRHLQTPKACTVSVVPAGDDSEDMLRIALLPTASCHPETVISCQYEGEPSNELSAHSSDQTSKQSSGYKGRNDDCGSLQAATPGQIVALYSSDGHICLGGGPIFRAY